MLTNLALPMSYDQASAPKANPLPQYIGCTSTEKALHTLEQRRKIDSLNCKFLSSPEREHVHCQCAGELAAEILTVRQTLPSAQSRLRKTRGRSELGRRTSASSSRHKLALSFRCPHQ